MTLYSVDETPELRITEKKAIPVEDANSKDADVILLSRRVDEDNHESNVRPTADFGRDIVAGAGLTRLQSISTIEFALAFEKLPDAIRQRLGEAKGPIFLDDETDRLFAPLIRPLRLSIDDYPNDLRFWQRQLTNGYSAEEKAFSVNLSRPQRGKRVYYLVAQTYSYRVGTLHSNVPRTIYDPSRRVVYVPVQKWVSYRIPKPLPLNPEVKEDALKGGARSSP